jgi:hypothetical protein
MTEHAAPPNPSTPAGFPGADLTAPDRTTLAPDSSLPLAGGGLGRGSSFAARAASNLTREPLALVTFCVMLGLTARLYGLNLAYTSDEGYWLQRSVVFGNTLMAGDFASTYRSGHPGVTVMWAGLIGIGPERAHKHLGEYSLSAPAIESSPDALRMMRSARAIVAVIVAGLFGLAVYLAGRLLGPPGYLGGVLVAADPYTVGMTRLLHVDALLTPLLLVSVLAGLVYWLCGRRWTMLALSAVAGGLALLTKAPAITLLPFFGIVWLVVARPWWGGWRVLLAPLSWAALLAAVYAALWPAFWVQPIKTLSDVAQFAVTLGGAPHLWPTYFLGRPTTGDPGLLFYPIAIALRLGPVATIGLLVLALLAALRRLPAGSTVLWLLIFVVIFIDVMAVGSKKFDRYMLPVLAVLTILSGVGIASLARLLSRKLATVVVAVAIVGQALWLASSYPYPIAAYNPLFGGTTVARQAIMVGWGEGLDQAADYLSRLPSSTRLTASTQYHHVLRLIFDGRTVRVPATRQVDYYVVYVNMIQRNTVPIPVRQAMATTAPVFTATVNGVPFAWVYKGPFQISSPRDVPSETGDDSEPDSDMPPD